MMYEWNLWHGCHKYSEGCKYCYVYRRDSKYSLDSAKVYKTKNFTLPIQKKKNGEYKLAASSLVWTCFTSDFLLEDADEWRKEAWQMIRERNDLHFLFITKRIERFGVNLPEDWGSGYDNVTVCLTCENQTAADFRLPIFLSLPIKHKQIVCSPLLSSIDLSKYLTDEIISVTVSGESGVGVRACNYDWVLDIREQCIKRNVSFYFRQTGTKFIKDGKEYHILKKYQHIQAKKANIDYVAIKEKKK